MLPRCSHPRRRATVAGFDVVRDGPKVRSSIGAALQEAALDPFLTGREHLRLQASLHGIKGRSAQDADRGAPDRVGLTHAADVRWRTYSRRNEAPPRSRTRIDPQPVDPLPRRATTGLDPQSRTALWEEVGALAREEGVTVS